MAFTSLQNNTTQVRESTCRPLTETRNLSDIQEITHPTGDHTTTHVHSITCELINNLSIDVWFMIGQYLAEI